MSGKQEEKWEGKVRNVIEWKRTDLNSAISHDKMTYLPCTELLCVSMAAGKSPKIITFKHLTMNLEF